MKAYEEIVEFIANGTDPNSVISFKPSDCPGSVGSGNRVGRQ